MLPVGLQKFSLAYLSSSTSCLDSMMLLHCTLESSPGYYCNHRCLWQMQLHQYKTSGKNWVPVFHSQQQCYHSGVIFSLPLYQLFQMVKGSKDNRHFYHPKSYSEVKHKSQRKVDNNNNSYFFVIKHLDMPLYQSCQV